MSTTRLPVESMPATTACFTISPEVRGSRPMTIVPGPVCVPKACAKRVRSDGVSDWHTTPRTPEILILRVGIARIYLKEVSRKGTKTQRQARKEKPKLFFASLRLCVKLILHFLI